ncbi:MAG: glycosyltransferase family 2 protein [Lachnospiraceae bacterium]|nr:glycosyltransferase family 2 protein [Lachnospiraceae bacterium]
MDDNKKVSVIVPVYNAQSYLEECIESIIGQTYEKIELILIDDGSKDHSPAICDQYAEKDDRIKVYHTKNAGAAHARNIGLSKATGDYIIFVDSDDFIAKETIEKCVAKLRESQAGLLIFNLCEMTDGKNREKILFHCEEREFDGSQVDYLRKLCLASESETAADVLCLAGICCKMYKAQLVKEKRFHEKLKLGEDWCFICDLLKDVKKAVYIRDVMYFRRVVHHSLSNTDTIRYIKRRLRFTNVMIESQKQDMEDDTLNRFCFNGYCMIVTKLFGDSSIGYFRKRKIIRLYCEKLKFNYDFQKIDYRCENRNYTIIRFLVKKKWYLVLTFANYIIRKKNRYYKTKKERGNR